jgi:hypothetical protein
MISLHIFCDLYDTKFITSNTYFKKVFDLQNDTTVMKILNLDFRSLFLIILSAFISFIFLKNFPGEAYSIKTFFLLSLTILLYNTFKCFDASSRNSHDFCLSNIKPIYIGQFEKC